MTAARQPGSAKRRGRPPKLTRTHILKTGLRLLRRHGRDRLTMRAVADALDVAPMSLYTHVRDKADLLVGVAACALEDLDLELDASGPWPEQIHAWAHSLRRQLLDYPEVAGLMDHQHWQSPQLLRIVRRPIGILIRKGVPEAVAVEVVQAIVWTAFGFVLVEEGQRRHPRSKETSPEVQLAAALESIPAGERAQIQPLLPHLVTRDFDRLYDAIVRRIVESLEKAC